MAALEAYHWPGNVRELRNVVERAVYRHEDPERAVDEIQFDPFHSPWAPMAAGTAAGQSPPTTVSAESHEEPGPAPPATTSDFRAAVADYERRLLEDALSRNRFNQRATAAALGLSYDQLRHALKRHRLQDAS
jgi:psp operon transcriptional activator